MSLLRKGWMSQHGLRPVRVVMDRFGNVFWRGGGGWTKPPDGATVRLLPKVVQGMNPRGWWTLKAWRDAAWAWIYSA